MADRISSDAVAQDQILAFVQRIERIEAEVKDLNADKAEVYAEAKGNGFDTKALKIVVSKRRMDLNERMELEAIVELYESALGMYAAPSHHEEDYQPRARARAHVETIDEFDADGVEIQPSGNSGEFNPASLTSNSQAERRPESTEQSAGANADEAVPSALSAPIQPATAAQTGSDVLSDRTPAEQVQVGPDPSLVEREAVESSATHSDAPDSPAFAEAGTPDSPASSSLGSAADKSESGGVSPALSAPTDHHALDTADLDPARVLLANCIECRARIYEGDEHYLTGPDHDELECGACGAPSEAVPTTKLKMNAEFFEEPHPACQRPGFCGGNSNVALCEVCRAAAHDGPTFQPEASVH